MSRRLLIGPPETADAGQIALLLLVYTLIALSLVVVAVDATAVHLARTQLLDAADSAALDAADALDEVTVYVAGVGTDLPLSNATVRDQASRYLSSYDTPSRLDQVELGAGTGSADGTAATVELTGRVRLPLAASVVAAWNQGITITVRSTARTAVLP